jgi:hypothetical protein
LCRTGSHCEQSERSDDCPHGPQAAAMTRSISITRSFR